MESKKFTSTTEADALLKPMTIGALIGLALISVFVFGVDQPNPEWGSYWRIRPLIIVPLAGATGGAFYYFMGYFRNQGGWKKVLANMVSFFVFIIGLWMGTVLGLVGTMWN